jgi:hypothetical protein
VNTIAPGCVAAEIRGLRWQGVDLMRRTVVIRGAKTEPGDRVIPLNRDGLQPCWDCGRESNYFLEQTCLQIGLYFHVLAAADPTKPMSGKRSAWRKNQECGRTTGGSLPRPTAAGDRGACGISG